jgi:hypothetical protein
LTLGAAAMASPREKGDRIMKHFALPALALTLATSAAAQPAQDSDRAREG